MPAGAEQFQAAITEMRNMHIPTGMSPLIDFRTELLGNDEFTNRSGTDDATRDHFLQLLLECDKWRRLVTYNPSGEELGAAIAKAVDPNGEIEVGDNPFGGDEIQTQSGRKFELPFRLDGSDNNMPLNSQIRLRNSRGTVILAAVDKAIVTWTRLESRNRTRFITKEDSMRIYGDYQQILGLVSSMMGEANRVDIAQVLPSDEPLGPDSSTNRQSEPTPIAAPAGDS